MSIGEIRPYVTDAVIEEYHRVFEYERLASLDGRRVANVLRVLEAAAFKVKSPGRLAVSEHESDNRIYECAVAATSKYIVTENARHFRKSHAYSRVVSARQLLALVDVGDR
ncbi:MAG TPA: PIN domain-containing protein [Candidatus Solibacter sp.]|nr:PIN domain-containing protein [Candidatus Solibacter sp.]